MVTSDLFYVAWRNVLRHYVWGIQMVEALMRRYGFGRLRIWVKPADVDIRWPGNLLWYAENFTQHFNIQLNAAMYHNSQGPYQ